MTFSATRQVIADLGLKNGADHDGQYIDLYTADGKHVVSVTYFDQVALSDAELAAKIAAAYDKVATA